MNLNSQGIPPWACLSTEGRAKGWHIFGSCSLWCEGDNSDENTWGDGSLNPIFAVWRPERRILRPLPSLLALRIPYEMLDLIVDHVPLIDVLSIPNSDPFLDRLIKESRAILFRWALVCRTWHRRCTQYLYSTITINRQAYDALALSLNRPMKYLRQNLRSVRVLYIRESDVNQFFRLVPRTLEIYLRKLHTLHVRPGIIEEKSYSPLQLDSTFFSLLPLLGAKVTSLTLIYLTWRSASDFWRVIACFPSLQKLSVGFGERDLHEALHWHNLFTNSSPYLRASKRPDLSYLYVEASSANETTLFEQILQWLLISSLPIRSLSIHPPVCLMNMAPPGHDDQIIALYSRLFQSVSPTLQDVTVGSAIGQ
ncbi:hypothetical protein WOLCODRAFT_163775 [Wolfiporia cocos MD-104 SS10]|uniref:F-box domain-containing protein n=1 Tax=Wolfiporia cocos (strain MD-104) TaxID=742152 RepID=A0A2H3K202_WOLCO|nr:hypothetical protein WOLCODRAFT_163775 [Wolfiporia cocos MD-104 SS10]